MIKWQIIAVVAAGVGIWCLWKFLKLYIETKPEERRKLLYIYVGVVVVSAGLFLGLKYSPINHWLGVPDAYNTISSGDPNPIDIGDILNDNQSD